MKQKSFLIFCIFILALFIFQFFLKNWSVKLYCLRKIHVKIQNVKKAAYQLGVVHIEEEEEYVNTVKNDLYQQCLRNQE